MLIPSIDLMGGKIVQLVQGDVDANGKPRIAMDDIAHWVEKFRAFPLVQLIDLDAAMGRGDNRALIEYICGQLPCQVGGGIRSVDRAREVLQAGAQRIILGSALFRAETATVNVEFAQQLVGACGRDAIVAGIDALGGRIAIHGWKRTLALSPQEAIPQLEECAGAFLYTHIDGEGMLGGFPLAVARELRSLTQRTLIVAGGIRSRAEVDALDAMRVDAVAGMAIYTNVFDYASGS